MKVLILTLIVLLAACETMPAYNVTARVAVERGTYSAVNKYGLEAVNQSFASGLVIPGSVLDQSIDSQITLFYKLSKGHWHSGGLALPILRPSHVIDDKRVYKWAMAVL